MDLPQDLVYLIQRSYLESFTIRVDNFFLLFLGGLETKRAGEERETGCSCPSLHVPQGQLNVSHENV